MPEGKEVNKIFERAESRISWRQVRRCVALSVLLGSAQLLTAQVLYTVTDLGSLGGTRTFPYAINNNGQVTGTSETGQIGPPAGTHYTHVFLYSNGHMADVGTLGGVQGEGDGINDLGQVTGRAYTSSGALRAFLYANRQMTNVGTLPAPYDGWSGGVAINNLGQIAGNSYAATGQNHAFLYSDGQMKDLGTLGGSGSSAFGLNNFGQVTGSSITSSGQERAFLYSNGQMTDLGTLGRAFAGFFSHAYAINNLGQVTGASSTSTPGVAHTFLYSTGQMIDLGVNGTGLAINDNGQIVGSFSSNSHPFLYSHGQVIDLTTAIDPALGVTLSGPTAINNAGQITAWGTKAGVSGIRAFLLTPLSPPITGPLQFVPVTPCRVADTRNPEDSFGGPKLAGGASRDFAIPNGACNIPASAVAYSLNVTVVPDAQLGYVTIWPTGQSQPYVSSLNSDGRIKANAAIIAAGNNGGVSVYVTDPTHLVLDIDGYFVRPGVSASSLAFYPVLPCRVADTRQGTGPLGGPYLSAGTSRSFAILSSSCSIPSTAQAYSLNFTAVPHGALSYLTVWPSGESQPFVSTLNAPTGTVVANAAIVPAGSGGDVSVYATDDTDLVIDINGYFGPPATDGLSLYTLAPYRVLDTRSLSGPFSGTFGLINMIGNCGSSAAQAYVLNATVVPLEPLDYLTLWPVGQPQPYVSTLNALDRAITSNMAIVPIASSLEINAFATNETQLILDMSAYFAP